MPALNQTAQTSGVGAVHINDLGKQLFIISPLSPIDGRDSATSVSYESLQMGDIPMTSRIPRLSYEHQEPLGRPSCPQCGQLCWFPERTEFAPGRVWNSWECESCTVRFQTSVVITSDTERRHSLPPDVIATSPHRRRLSADCRRKLTGRVAPAVFEPRRDRRGDPSHLWYSFHETDL